MAMIIAVSSPLVRAPEKRTSAAKAGAQWKAFMARLKPCPFEDESSKSF